jgi:glycosyltransferase involved in cell wall biosynthesis
VRKIRLLIEGWRGINHSYALVNQNQMLELLKRPEVELSHRDMPFYGRHWNPVDNFGGFDAEEARAIASVPPPDGTAPDVVYRAVFPYRFYGGDSAKIFCFATAEHQEIESHFVYQGPECAERHANGAVEIVTPSHWSKEGFLRYGFKSETVHVVPHGINPAHFHPLAKAVKDEARAQLGIPPDAFVFLNVGGMAMNKGIDELLLAFAEIRKKHKHAMLLLKDLRGLYGLTGEGKFAQVRRDHPGRFDDATVAAVGILSKSVDIGRLRLIYNMCDAYVSPYKAEGFNLPPLEAAACGLPIAVTAGGSTDDYAQPCFALKIAARKMVEGTRSSLVPDFDSLVACMEALIERRANEMDTARAVAFIAENNTWAKAVDKLAALFAG